MTFYNVLSMKEINRLREKLNSLRTDVNTALNDKYDKTGGTLTGDVTISKDIPTIYLDANRTNTSKIEWNANSTTDSGLRFTVDGNYVFNILSNGTVRTYDGTSYHNIITTEGGTVNTLTTSNDLNVGGITNLSNYLDVEMVDPYIRLLSPNKVNATTIKWEETANTLSFFVDGQRIARINATSGDLEVLDSADNKYKSVYHEGNLLKSFAKSVLSTDQAIGTSYAKVNFDTSKIAKNITYSATNYDYTIDHAGFYKVDFKGLVERSSDYDISGISVRVVKTDTAGTVSYHTIHHDRDKQRSRFIALGSDLIEFAKGDKFHVEVKVFTTNGTPYLKPSASMQSVVSGYELTSLNIEKID